MGRPRAENTVNISNKIPYFSIIIIDKNKKKEDYRFNSQEQQSRKNKTSSKDSYFSVIKKDDTVRGSFDGSKVFFMQREKLPSGELFLFISIQMQTKNIQR